MELRKLDDEFRGVINQYIKDEWGGPKIVTRGNLYDSSQLPGFVAVDGDIFTGAALYRVEDGECELACLFSLAYSKGTGTALINMVVEKARELGCRRVWLVTTNDNTYAIRFYQKRGFSLKAVHINAFEVTRRLKFENETILGIDGIPILHEFEFEILL